MRWAAVATSSAWEEGNARPVTVPYPRLSHIIRPKGGNTGVIIAAPGQGKTTFMLNWVVKAGMKALYISSDTSPADVTAQLGALATGNERRLVEQQLAANMTWRREYATAIYRKYPNLILDFSPRPTMAEIRNKALALTEMWGEPPEIIVMDTASNVAMEDMSNNAEWQRVWLDAINLARELNCFFLFCHHVKQGPARGGRVAPELNDGLWGCDQFPEFVMGLHTPDAGQLTLTVRKNRGGAKDVPVRFDVDFPRADIAEAAPRG